MWGEMCGGKFKENLAKCVVKCAAGNLKKI